MLQSLSIRNVVLIDSLDAGFDRGLCALTGETGAGKSILLGALGLAAGERAERGLVRAGTDEASATAEFDLAPGHAAWAVLEEAGLVIEPGEALILRRRLSEDGRSRAHINDQPASIGLLRSLGDVLVEVHGQHDGRGLLDPKTHRAQLDSYAGNAPLREACRKAWATVSTARNSLADLVRAHSASTEEQDFLRHALGEIDKMQPRPGEEEALAEERQFLMAAERALGDLQEAQDALAGDGGGLEGRLNTAVRGLERVRDQIGSAGGEAGSALDRASAAIERALKPAMRCLTRRVPSRSSRAGWRVSRKDYSPCAPWPASMMSRLRHCPPCKPVLPNSSMRSRMPVSVSQRPKKACRRPRLSIATRRLP